jgi:hypothetical protein
MGRTYAGLDCPAPNSQSSSAIRGRNFGPVQETKEAAKRAASFY